MNSPTAGSRGCTKLRQTVHWNGLQYFKGNPLRFSSFSVINANTGFLQFFFCFFFLLLVQVNTPAALQLTNGKEELYCPWISDESRLMIHKKEVRVNPRISKGKGRLKKKVQLDYLENWKWDDHFQSWPCNCFTWFCWIIGLLYPNPLNHAAHWL